MLLSTLINQKYGINLEEIQVARKHDNQIGESLEFTFRYYDEMRMYNTFKAHQLLHWAGEQGRQTELKLAFFDSYEISNSSG